MLMSTPVAPVMEMLSSNGDEIACCTASMARFSPRPMPVPMIAAPPFCITVRTSAKSTFTMPVTVMREEMPWVACSKTSSAFLSASWNGIPLPTTASSRSFGTTTMVSTCLRISAIPISAWRIRLRPSNRNGLVTMPIVSAPRSRAICEMMGAAPVPVPPPMPHVTNTRSAPCRPCRTSSRFSSMAWRPISGRAPAPRPRVGFFPICTFTSALLLSRACASVFTEMNSTPWSPSSTMRFRALPPPPPTPTTFIRAFCDTVSSSSKIMAPSGDRSEEVLQPPLQRSEPPLDARTLDQRPAGHAALRESPRRVQHQAYRHRVPRRLHAVDEPRDALLRRPGPYRDRERLARQLHHPRQVRRPARQHHPGRQPSAPVPRPLELALRQLEDLVHPLVDDVRQQLARCLPRPLARRRRQVDHLRRVHERLIRHPMTLLEPLRIRLRHPQPCYQVARDMRAGILERREVPDLSLVEDRHTCRPPSHLHQGDSQLLLVVRQHGVGRGERLQHQLGRPVARPLHAAAQVLRSRGWTVTRYISTSSRVPVIPTGSEIPRCWSTTYSCGISCSSSWSRPSDTARATSFTRATSSAVISSPDTATTPGDVRAETCSPAMPHVTVGTLTPAMRSASRIAATIDRLVSSMSRTIPRRTPAFFASPTPSTFASGSRGSSPTTSAITAHVLVLPRSSPATIWRSRLTPPHRPRSRPTAVAPPPGPRSGHRAPRTYAPSRPDPAPPAPRPV